MRLGSFQQRGIVYIFAINTCERPYIMNSGTCSFVQLLWMFRTSIHPPGSGIWLLGLVIIHSRQGWTFYSSADTLKMLGRHRLHLIGLFLSGVGHDQVAWLRHDPLGACHGRCRRGNYGLHRCSVGFRGRFLNILKNQITGSPSRVIKHPNHQIKVHLKWGSLNRCRRVLKTLWILVV